nr:zinc finger, CCHC-type, retrotransposon Gag domain protein [Tanacetum cinerariifolium]
MNDFRNEMESSHNFTACDVPKFDGTLDSIAYTKWLFAVEGAFRTSCCKEKNKVNFASNFLRDSAKMSWDGKIYKKGEEWIETCTWKEFKEMFTTAYAPAKKVDKIQEEFQTLTQTNETVNELWKKFNDLIRSSKQKAENSNFEENPLPPEIPMAENQTMAQLLQAPTDGYKDAIVIPEIAATNFEL